MPAGCARCGGCCDPVPFTRAQHTAAISWSTEAMRGMPDPGTEQGWMYWRSQGWTDEDRWYAIRQYDPAGTNRANADFIAAHWWPTSDTTCACDAYDAATRLCTAHDSRPPVCSDYPWYGDEPDSEVGMPPQCSYWADLPPARRPEGARPLIPITVLERSRA